MNGATKTMSIIHPLHFIIDLYRPKPTQNNLIEEYNIYDAPVHECGRY